MISIGFCPLPMGGTDALPLAGFVFAAIAGASFRTGFDMQPNGPPNIFPTSWAMPRLSHGRLRPFDRNRCNNDRRLRCRRVNLATAHQQAFAPLGSPVGSFMPLTRIAAGPGPLRGNSPAPAGPGPRVTTCLFLGVMVFIGGSPLPLFLQLFVFGNPEIGKRRQRNIQPRHA